MSDLLAGLPREIRTALVREAERLLALLPDGFEKATAAWLRLHYLPMKGETGTQKLDIGKYPTAALLGVNPARDLPRLQERDLIRAWALVGALRFCAAFNETDHFSRVQAGLRVARLMVANRYKHDLMANLPEFDGSLADLQQALRRAKTTFAQRGLGEADHLHKLQLTLGDAADPRAPRMVDDASRTHSTSEDFRPSHILKSDGLTILQIGDNLLPADAPPEEVQEELRDFLYDFGPAYKGMPLAQAHSEAQLELLEREATEAGFQTSYASLTPTETRNLFSSALRDAHQARIGAGLVLAIMATGRTLEALVTAARHPISEETWRDANGGVGYVPKVRFLAKPAKAGFLLRPPDALKGWIPDAITLQDAQIEVQKWLKLQSFDRPIRLSRIERTLHDTLLASTEDPALAAMLCAKRNEAAIQLHYARFKVPRLREEWLEALSDHYGHNAGFKLEALSPRRPFIGSLISPDMSAISIWFQDLVAQVDVARKPKHTEGLEHLVNRIAVEANLAAAVLCFQTARRFHRAAFEPLSQITGARRRRVRLDGKGGRQVDDGRWVPLAAASNAAITMWTNSLERVLHSGLASANRPLGMMIQAVLKGDAPLFFAWDSLEAPPIPLSASALYQRIGAPQMPQDRVRLRQGQAPDNWARHFMRGALVEHGLTGLQIDAFLGHGGAVADPMAPASGFAIADHDRLREALDEIWNALEIKLPDAGLC